jgi:hypothetical protein
MTFGFRKTQVYSSLKQGFSGEQSSFLSKIVGRWKECETQAPTTLLLCQCLWFCLCYLHICTAAYRKEKEELQGWLSYLLEAHHQKLSHVPKSGCTEGWEM